jgi:dephospho-CoA kinase
MKAGESPGRPIPLAVGLTGGIGSGKTVVAKIFECLGVPVYYADNEAKRLMNEDPGLRSEIIGLFGEKAYSSTELNRKHISSIVFNDPGKLARLNALVHPVTIRDAEEWRKKQTTPYIIKEAALLFESGASKALDKVIGVSAPLELRIRRVMNRDLVTRDEVLKRIGSQMDEKEKMGLCDYVIVNDEVQFLVPQVLKFHQLHFLY